MLLRELFLDLVVNCWMALENGLTNILLMQKYKKESLELKRQRWQCLKQV